MKVAVLTLGCKTNQYESEIIKESFSIRENEIVDFREKADLYVINSCVVTLKAEAETRKAISEALSKNKYAKIIITGCFASLAKNFNRQNVQIFSGRKTQLADFALRKLFSEDMGIDSESIFEFSEHTRAVLKVEEGCNNFCSYCIVPFVKGQYVQSKDIDVVIREAENLVNKGYKEIVLTGTEIGKYGEEKGTNLAELVKNLKRIENMNRLRISSIHPKHVSDLLIKEIEPPVVPHLHISLQSGDNEVLKLMNRNYTREYFQGIVNRLREIDKNFSISTDVIVGFPGETEEAFFNSIYMVRDVQFSKVHIFRFSKRPYTPAYFLKETSSESQKKIRAERLKEFAYAEQKSFKERFLEEMVEVLVEEKKEYCEGFTPHYLRVKFTGNARVNELAKVKIKKVDAEYMYGESL